MTESIGTARLDIVVDTSSLDAAATKATRTTQDIGKAAQGASASMEQNSRRQVASLEKQIATLGKSREEIIRWRIEQQTSGKVAADLASKLDAQVKHLNNSGKALNAYGMSAKQTAAALRGLPAQVTDIVTGLASGQRPLTILFQQGGQLKDMFGGIVPAARALGGAIVGLVNPFTVAAAAVIGLGAAWAKASQESENFNKALILSGNQAGLTSRQLEGMAASVAKATNTTQGQVSGALAQVAASGQFTAAQMQMVAQAAVQMQQATGQSIEKTIADFASLKGDPLDGILKLNDAIGDGTNVTHFLTQAQAEEIAKLKEQGDEAGATEIAFRALFDGINSRAPQAAQQMSLFSSVLQGIKRDAQADLDSIVGFFRGADTAIRNFLLNNQKALKALTYLTPLPYQGQLRQTLDEVTAAAAKAGRPSFANVTDGSGAADSKLVRAKVAAADEFGKIVESHLSKQKKLEEEIAHIREVGRKAGIDSVKIEEQVSAARAAAAEKGAGGRVRGGGGRASVSRPLPDFSKGAADELQRQAEAEDRATQSFLDMQAALDGPLAQAEREHIKRVAELNDLASKSPEAAAGLTSALEKEAAAHAKNVAAIKAELDPLGQMAADMQFELEMIGKSNAERAVMIELRRNHIDALSAEGQAALANAKAFEAEAQAKQQSIDLMDDFRRGAADALTEFVTGAKSAKDALKDFFNTLAEEITRAIANKWIQQLFGSQGTSGQGTSGGNMLGSFFGSLFGGGWGGIAKGAAFPAGVTPFANGGIVSSPHLFASAGRLGLMGEAGPEAILPLHRGPDGKLGVRMAANDDMPRHLGPATVNQTIVVQGRIDSRTPDQFAQATARAQNRAASRNR